jgi:zinc protease
MVDRTVAPPFEKATSFPLPTVETLTIGQGLKMFVVPGVQQEVIKIELLFEAGRWFEPHPGVAHFTSQMLEKGTSKKDALQLAEAFESLGAHMEIVAGLDNIEISLFALTRNWRDAFRLIEEMILDPSFNNEELDIMKSIYLENLKVNLAKNSFVASQAIRKNIFGTHPYGVSVAEQDVAAIDSTQLREYHKLRLVPNAAFITAPASVDREKLSKALAGFTRQTGAATTVRPVVPGLRDELIEKQDSVQSSLRLGMRMVKRMHPDYPHVLLLNHILGGYFGSRLMKNIREEKGLTYGIYSSLNNLQRDGFFMIGADVNKENRELAFSEINRELIRLREEKIEKDELEIAANHFLGALQLEVANPFSVTEKVKNIFVNDLPADYYQTIFDKVSSATPAQLAEIAAVHFPPENLYKVAVG